MSRAFEAIVLSVCDRCALSVVERGACRDRCIGVEYACCTARRRAVRIIPSLLKSGPSPVQTQRSDVRVERGMGGRGRNNWLSGLSVTAAGRVTCSVEAVAGRDR